MVEENTVELTETDRSILRSYSSFCEGLADYLGDGYEIVLHSLESFDRSVIKIINGYYTGRKEGAPITDLALRMLGNIRENGDGGYYSYFAKNKKGEPMRSTTIVIRGEEDRAIGLLCINFYMNTPLSKVIGCLVDSRSGQDAVMGENFVDDPQELITGSVIQIRDEVMADASVTAHNKNKEIISRLVEKGVFQMKDSVNHCADILGISRNTVYMHIRNNKGEHEN